MDKPRSGDTNYDLFDFASQSGNFSSNLFGGGFYTGSLTYSGGLWTGDGGPAQEFSFDQGTGILSVTAVPEPASALLGGLGLLALLRRRDR